MNHVRFGQKGMFYVTATISLILFFKKDNHLTNTFFFLKGSGRQMPFAFLSIGPFRPSSKFWYWAPIVDILICATIFLFWQCCGTKLESARLRVLDFILFYFIQEEYFEIESASYISECLSWVPQKLRSSIFRELSFLQNTRNVI